MAFSPFRWFHKHQKHMLFVLAVVLIVGWLMWPALSPLLQQKVAGSGQEAQILGKTITAAEHNDFTARWNLLTRNEQQGDNGFFTVNTSGMPEDMAVRMNQAVYYRAWSYLAALKLADQMGVKVSEDQVNMLVRGLYAKEIGQQPAAVDLSGAGYQNWLRRKGLSGQAVENTVRESLKIQQVMGEILGAVEPTMVDALNNYLDNHREYELKYAMIKDEDFMKTVKEPTEVEIQAYYENNNTRGAQYWKNETYDVGYVEVSYAAVEGRIAITSAEIEEYYNKHREDYVQPAAEKTESEKEKAAGAAVGDATKEKKPEAATPAPVKYFPLADVKGAIEASLKHQRAEADSKKLMDAVVKAYNEQPKDKADLETAVRTVKDQEAVTYVRTGLLTARELMELSAVGSAKSAEGQYFFNLVADSDREGKDLSQVLTTPEKGLYVFRVLQYAESGAESLDKIHDKVVTDVKRTRAAEAGKKRAEELLAEMSKAGSDFDKMANANKMVVVTTLFFRNSMLDPERPNFLPMGLALRADSKLLGPMRAESDRAYVLAVVADKHEASTSEFAGEMATDVASVRTQKIEQLHTELITGGLLKYVGFKAPTGTGGSAPMPLDDGWGF